MKRIYHHYLLWEEIHQGMWRTLHGEARKPFLEAASQLMKNPSAFYLSMQRASVAWRHSCEVHLSGGYNRQAWMGHAGCCFSVNSPEDITREAWHTLTMAEQDEANRMADLVLTEWDARQCQNED